VYGVKPGATEATEELRRQYAQAEEFFVGLAERFFDGNRERIVILPGNHDVCYEDMMASGQKIRIPVEPDKKDLLLLIFYAELSIKVVLARVMLLQDPRRPISEASSILCRNLQTLL
jgi:hypothetical protein